MSMLCSISWPPVPVQLKRVCLPCKGSLICSPGVQEDIESDSRGKGATFLAAQPVRPPFDASRAFVHCISTLLTVKLFLDKANQGREVQSSS